MLELSAPPPPPPWAPAVGRSTPSNITVEEMQMIAMGRVKGGLAPRALMDGNRISQRLARIWNPEAQM
eukprot:3727968-Karenia_brevis.AAC.1